MTVNICFHYEPVACVLSGATWKTLPINFEVDRSIDIKVDLSTLYPGRPLAGW
jgi:hypothetical protein